MKSPNNLLPSAPHQNSGYILLEVMLALAIFALVVMGLANALEHTTDTMLSSNRESQIRLGLESLLAQNKALAIELGSKPDPSDDPTVTFEHEWKALRMVNSDNLQLNDLYELSVRAKWIEEGQERSQEAKITLYRPQP